MDTFRISRGFRSPVLLAVAVAALLSAALVAAGVGPDARPKANEKFLGLWEGVDPLDGSPVRLSLSDVDNDGTLEHTMQEDFLTTCFNLGAGYSKGRGVITGTATAGGPNVLDAVTQLICIADNNTHTSLGTAPNQYVLASHDRNLVLPAFGNSPAIVLHRIAE